MKKIQSLFLFLAIITAITLSSAEGLIAQDVPKMYVSTNKKTYSPGETGTLIITFKPGAKVKIPKEPQVEVILSSSDVQGAGLQPIQGAGDYITGNKVKYNFTVPSNASGQVTISGAVKFGYCNEDNGVCKFGNKSFSIKRTVK